MQHRSISFSISNPRVHSTNWVIDTTHIYLFLYFQSPGIQCWRIDTTHIYLFLYFQSSSIQCWVIDTTQIYLFLYFKCLGTQCWVIDTTQIYLFLYFKCLGTQCWVIDTTPGPVAPLSLPGLLAKPISIHPPPLLRSNRVTRVKFLMEACLAKWNKCIALRFIAWCWYSVNEVLI